MVIDTKTKEQIRNIRQAGKIVAACHREIAKKIKPGVTTFELNQFADLFFTEHGAVAAQRGYKGYPYSICASVNEVACHGFPSKEPLRSGDIVTIDMVADVKGWKADSAKTYAVGTPSPQIKQLLVTAKAAMYAGIRKAVAGNYVGDIGRAAQARANKDGFHIVPAFVGHGIGRHIHEYPQIPNHEIRFQGEQLIEGMVITIEPIVTTGSTEVYIGRDGWVAKTIDHSWTAQFEHTVLITKEGPQILTRLPKK